MSQNKKQKRHHPDPTSTTSNTSAFIAQHHPEKPSARALPSSKGGRDWTISVAVPGSIVKNAQTKELRGWLAGQIARTCAIFTVSEIIVYRDPSSDNSSSSTSNNSYKPRGKYRDTEGSHSGGGEEEEEDGTSFLARLLGYLETPQYLRKSLFPLHPSLRLAGLLPPLDCPHHLRRDDLSPFREAVVVEGRGKGGRVKVDVGAWEMLECEIGNGGMEMEGEVGKRVTVRMPERDGGRGTIVPPSTPTSESGLYWGYSVRVANSLAQVFSECPYNKEGEAGEGYDVSIGTSERGSSIEDLVEELESGESKDFKHLLLTFGPLSGLELSIASDPLIPLGAEDSSDLFDHWVNVVKGQGSRTVRTEEALMIALGRMWGAVEGRL